MVIKNLQASARIIAKAKELGANLAGWASISDLKNSPSVRLAPQMPYRRDEFKKSSRRLNPKLKLKHGEVSWPKNAKSVLAIAVSHPQEKPELDWWFGKTNPPGNKVLISIIDSLCKWIETQFEYEVKHLPYQVGQGGLFLKDVCVLAGIGCIGDNNLLITPEFGPRIRLRALTVNVAMPSTGPAEFYPCASCHKPCRKVCPRSAMKKMVYTPQDYDGMTSLPGRTGVYDVSKCDLEISENVVTATNQMVEGLKEEKTIIKYCRRCEFACPIGA